MVGCSVKMTESVCERNNRLGKVGFTAPTARAGGAKEAPEERCFDCYTAPALGDWLLLANDN